MFVLLPMKLLHIRQSYYLPDIKLMSNVDTNPNRWTICLGCLLVYLKYLQGKRLRQSPLNLIIQTWYSVETCINDAPRQMMTISKVKNLVIWPVFFLLANVWCTWKCQWEPLLKDSPWYPIFSSRNWLHSVLYVPNYFLTDSLMQTLTKVPESVPGL